VPAAVVKMTVFDDDNVTSVTTPHILSISAKKICPSLVVIFFSLI